MNLVITAKAEKDILKLSGANRQRVEDAIDTYMTRPETLDIQKLKGQKNHWRIRVGVHRIILLIIRTDDTTYILRVRHRKDAYQILLCALL